MAKSFASVALRAIKAAERERVRQAKAEVREHNAAIREQARAAKAHEADMRRMAVANERDRKAYIKEEKAAYVASRLDEVESLNAEISSVQADLDGLLAATLDVDDYVDLELLRKSADTIPFDKPELEMPLVQPKKPARPLKPSYEEPEKPKGLFGKKKKLAEATALATEKYEADVRRWEQKISAAETKHAADIAAYETAEADRLRSLETEKSRFLAEIEKHNESVDQFISNLAYGDAEAIQDYIALVVENSVYPDHFRNEHEFSFVTETAELTMQVAIPAPKDFPAIKTYKYVKASDEIRETPVAKTEFRKRYCSALYQVAIRSLHEVFEADRRGLIKTIALQVGTNESNPATGQTGFLPFIGVGAEKASFMEFDLSGVVPEATLKHLGAAISKDPVNLVAADLIGVRKS